MGYVIDVYLDGTTLLSVGTTTWAIGYLGVRPAA